MELFKASEQWSNRPDDERFGSVEALNEACQEYRKSAREAEGVAYKTLRVQAEGGECLLVGKQNIPSKLTHWAFGQLAQRAEAPAGYLRSLSPTLAAQNLNYGLARRGEDEKC